MQKALREDELLQINDEHLLIPSSRFMFATLSYAKSMAHRVNSIRAMCVCGKPLVGLQCV